MALRSHVSSPGSMWWEESGGALVVMTCNIITGIPR